MLERGHGHKLRQSFVRVMGWIVIVDPRPALVAVAPPLLLECRPSKSLTVFQQSNQLWSGEHRSIGGLLLHLLLLNHHLLCYLLLLLHSLKEHSFLLMLNHLHACLLETRKDLLLLVEAKTGRLALRESDLHRTQVPFLWDQHSLLVEFLDGCFSLLERGHPNKRASHIAHGLGVDDENLQNLAKLLKALAQHALGHFARQAAHEELHATLLAFDQGTSIVGIAFRLVPPTPPTLRPPTSALRPPSASPCRSTLTAAAGPPGWTLLRRLPL
mmetsp:Transcript_16845/g.45608  ORF Transcript_16845/g.45608 Transcript_16845/m.45608 type:complete len:271 (+) Transcript_16845:510-1322(+)